jgi:antirestriction protein ArdC
MSASSAEAAGKRPDWSALLVEAVSKKGVISSAYSTFWNYSVGNQLLAWFQCAERHLTQGPIHTFNGWRELGRFVKRGERALSLCMPINVKRKARDQLAEEVVTGDGAERIKSPETFTRFIYPKHWFVLSQTEGKDYVPTQIPEWSESRALEALLIERVAFAHSNGNVQGYAVEKQVAISPVAFMPHRTLFHELAHIVLGHTEELRRLEDEEATPKNLREVEAESVALICCESLGLSGAEFSRGYIQQWLSGEKIPERSAQRIFKAADVILKAGRPVTQAENTTTDAR